MDSAAATPQVGTILSANSTAQLGTVVVDGQGFTLYRFDKDSAKPPTSNCADECAQKWPPVLATPGTPLTVEGVEQEAVGTINRPDGTIQLTLNGWPVYRYSGDPQPGATAGQGIEGGEWAAVTPEGAEGGCQQLIPAVPTGGQDGGQGGVWVSGGPRGLQNRRGRGSRSGGFDSRPPPPISSRTSRAAS